MRLFPPNTAFFFDTTVEFFWTPYSGNVSRAECADDCLVPMEPQFRITPPRPLSAVVLANVPNFAGGVGIVGAGTTPPTSLVGWIVGPTSAAHRHIRVPAEFHGITLPPGL